MCGVPGLPNAFLPLVAAPVLLDSHFGTVQVAFRLTELETLPAHVGLPENSVVTVVNGAGTIIFRSLDPKRWVGVNIANLPIYRQIKTATDAFVAPGLDGVEQLLAVAPVPGTDWLAIVGVPAGLAFAPLNASLDRELPLFGLTLALAGVFAWRGKVLGDQVEDERRRLETTIDQLPEGVLATDASGRVLQANGALAAILGTPVRRGAGYRAEIDLSVSARRGALPASAPVA